MENGDILEKADPMIRNAEKQGLWFYKKFNKFPFFEIWLSPKEFREIISSGRKWFLVNWSLRNPEERIYELQGSIQAMTEEISSIKEECEKITIKEC